MIDAHWRAARRVALQSLDRGRDRDCEWAQRGDRDRAEARCRPLLTDRDMLNRRWVSCGRLLNLGCANVGVVEGRHGVAGVLEGICRTTKLSLGSLALLLNLSSPQLGSCDSHAGTCTVAPPQHHRRRWATPRLRQPRPPPPPPLRRRSLSARGPARNARGSACWSQCLQGCINHSVE